MIVSYVLECKRMLNKNLVCLCYGHIINIIIKNHIAHTLFIGELASSFSGDVSFTTLCQVENI